MWFKNVQIYQLTESFPLSADELEKKLQSQLLKPCPKSLPFNFGWVSPFGKDSVVLVHPVQHYFLMAACRQERVLPTSIVREALNEQIEDIKQREGRVVSRKERNRLRDEITFELLQQAFVRKQTVYGYIDTENDWLVIDSSSRSRAEEFVVLLRSSIGSLKVEPPQTQHKPSRTMTNWLLNKQLPPALQVADSCEMTHAETGEAIVRCSKHDLSANEVIGHLKSGKEINKLGLSWQDRLSFVLNDDLSIKRIKFLEVLQERRQDIQAETKEEQLDADFSLMTMEFNEFFQQLFSYFEGLRK